MKMLNWILLAANHVKMEDSVLKTEQTHDSKEQKKFISLLLVYFVISNKFYENDHIWARKSSLAPTINVC